MLTNLTPHTITIALASGERIAIPPSGRVARVVTAPAAPAGDVAGVPVVRRPAVGGVIEGLPAPEAGAFYVVSAAVLAALEACGDRRQDVLAPGTGPSDGVIRDDRGQVAAVTRLVGLPTS